MVKLHASPTGADSTRLLPHGEAVPWSAVHQIRLQGRDASSAPTAIATRTADYPYSNALATVAL